MEKELGDKKLERKFFLWKNDEYLKISKHGF